MKILFLFDRPYLPQVVGGTESSTNDLCLALKETGIDISVICDIYPHGALWIINRLISKVKNNDFPCDKLMKYPVYRGWSLDSSIHTFLKSFRPDTIIIKNGLDINILNVLINSDSKIVNYIRDLNDNNPLLYPQKNNITYIANSNFTANNIKLIYGISPSVLPPLIFKDRFKAEHIIENNKKITFIGLDSKKGVELAFSIAETLPQHNFQFYESWTLSKEKIKMYIEKGKKLGNVVVKRRTLDVSNIYNSTKILLFPSQYDETWGRVASEAHLFGIPVVASNIGGIPESVGPGGVLVSPSAPTVEWANAISNILDNEHVYRTISNAAVKYSQREEFQPKNIIKRFIEICCS